MSKTKYRLKNAANQATFYTGKFAVAPVVAVVDTTVAAGQATFALTKNLGKALLHVATTPIAGAARGNEIYKSRFAAKHQARLERNRKLASGEYVEVIVPAEANEDVDA